MLGLFPGQGSQFVGMGKDLYENFKSVQTLFEEASDAVSINFKKLIFEGPESDLNLTENTQPALLLVSTACAQLLKKELNWRPTRLAGHSLGEYSALVANDAFPFSSAVRWVRERGLAMQKAVPVGMGSLCALLGATDEDAEKLCQEVLTFFQENHQPDEFVQPANYNAPGQLVIAGTTQALQKLAEVAREKKIKSIPLDVSAPFHSRLMKTARDRMEEIFQTTTENEKPKKLLVPYYPNRTAEKSQTAKDVFPLLTEQVDHPVLWKQSMTHALNDFQNSNGSPEDPEKKPLTVIEIGPGKVLQGLMKRIAKDLNAPVTLTGVQDLESFRAFEKIYRSL